MRALIGGWLLLLVLGMAALAFHGSQPGEAADAPPEWPTASRLQRAVGQPTLLLFAHPECPCTRASLAELARLLVRCPGLRASVVLRPGPAISLPRGVTAVQDEGLAETARFGAFTSGQVLLYGTDGRLRFAGGITGSRGHEGDNDGADAVARAVTGGSGLSGGPVFGCRLGNDEFCRPGH